MTYSDPHWSWKSYMPLKARTAPKGGSYNTPKLINSNIKAINMISEYPYL